MEKQPLSFDILVGDLGKHMKKITDTRKSNNTI